MGYGFIRRYCFNIAAFFQFAVVMLTVATIFDIVQIIARLLTQQAQALGASDMELLLTIRFIALHTGAYSGAMWFTQFLAYITI